MLDNRDRVILRQLQAEPGMAMPDLAARVGQTPAKVSRRVERLQEDGLLMGQRWDVDWRALGYSIFVSLRISLDKTIPTAFDDFIRAARDVPQVLEIQTFLGRVDVRLSLIATDLVDYQQVYREQILALPHIADIEALMDVARVKSNRDLPL
jgi:Lrp/AsnC family transcriptional regulator